MAKKEIIDSRSNLCCSLHSPHRRYCALAWSAHSHRLRLATMSGQSFTHLATHPHLFPAVVARCLTDQDLATCTLISKSLHTTLTTHATFWRYICHRTYRLPAYRPPKPTALNTFKSWKDYWYTRPRVHTHGFYAVKISYIPVRGRGELPPGQVEVGSGLSGLKLGEIRLISYYRYFWFQPNGTVKHTCVPNPPNEVKQRPEGLFPLSTSRRCCGRVVNTGTYQVRAKNQITIDIPNIGPDSKLAIELKIGYEEGHYYDGTNGAVSRKEVGCWLWLWLLFVVVGI